MTVYQSEEIKKFIADILTKVNIDLEKAEIVADSLVKADLEGVSSHGVSRLPIYVKRLRENRINSQPKLKIERSAPAVLMVDGDNGLGQIVACKAFQEGMKIAKENGLAAVAVYNSNHFGCASYYCQLGFEKNLASIITTNSPSGIPPWGGKQAFFGTNPIAFGFPVKEADDVIIDLSSSVVARGKIIQAAKEGKSIPKGWAIDEHGHETTNAKAALKGAVLPAGGVKGYGIALAVEILSALLPGAAYGPFVQNIYQEKDGPAKVGHFFILIDIESFQPWIQFDRVLKKMLNEIKNSPKADGIQNIFYPGERRAASFREKSVSGIELASETVKELVLLATEYKVPFPQ